MIIRRIYGVASPSARIVRIQALVLGLCTLLSLNALAFSSSLQPEEIQDAYSLGQTTNHEELVNFLIQYQHDLKYPSDDSSAYVQSVEFQTPFEQIVLRSRQTVHYTKFQAAEDYRANPELIIVRVVVSLKTGYQGKTPTAEKFKVTVSQTKSIEPRKVDSKLVCNPYNVDTNCLAYTREILLQFGAAQFGPGKATVTVILPEGRSMETKYNLDKLK